MTNSADALLWRELHWQRPLDPLRIAGCFRQWATDQQSPRIIVETELSTAGAQYRLGWPAATSGVAASLRALGIVSLQRLAAPR